MTERANLMQSRCSGAAISGTREHHAGRASAAVRIVELLHEVNRATGFAPVLDNLATGKRIPRRFCRGVIKASSARRRTETSEG